MDEVLRNYVRKADDVKEKNRDKSSINSQASAYPADTIVIADTKNVSEMQW